MKLPNDLGLLLVNRADYSTIVATSNTKTTAEWLINRLRGRLHYMTKPNKVPHCFLWILDSKENIPAIKLLSWIFDNQGYSNPVQEFGHLALAIRYEFSHKLPDFVDSLVERERFSIVEAHEGIAGIHREWFLLRAPDDIGGFYTHIKVDRSDTMKDPHLRSEGEPDTIFFDRDPHYEQDCLRLAQFQKEEVPLPTEDSAPIEPVVGPEVPLELGEDEEGTGD